MSTLQSMSAMLVVPCSTKFLVDRGGNPVRRFKSGFDPMSFEDDVSLITAHVPPLTLLCTVVWQQCLHSRSLPKLDCSISHVCC